MEPNAVHLTDRPTTTTVRSPKLWGQLIVVLAMSASIGAHGTAPLDTDLPGAPAAQGVSEIVEPQAYAPTDSYVTSGPDSTATEVGGIAARLRDGETAIAGDLFLLLAVDGSDRVARLYDSTAYTLRSPHIHPGARASNDIAFDVVGNLLERDLPLIEFTSAPGGGPSAGLTYAIGYLNVESNGAFTGAVSVASTGALTHDGYVQPILAIDEKAAAAHLADVDVLFTPSTPTAGTVTSFGSRFEGELFRARNPGARLADERLWEHYEGWGADRPGGMDIIAVRHIGDVAAYLCGTGSDYACMVRDTLGNSTDISQATAGANARDTSAYTNVDTAPASRQVR